MSKDEMREQKAMLLFEHHETLEELAALRESAKRTGQAIAQFGKWLAEDAARKIYVRGQDQYGLSVDQLDDEYSKSVDFQKAITLADEIRAVTAKAKNLAERKRDLGLM